MRNLDHEAMKTAGRILTAAKGPYEQVDVENLATKGLGVVLEQGVYAGMLFFYSKRKLDNHGKPKPSEADLFIEHLFRLTTSFSNPAPKISWEDPLDGLGFLAGKVCHSLDETIFVKTIWEQTLTYVRYGAKALQKAGEK